MIDRMKLPPTVYIVDGDPLSRSLIVNLLRTYQFDVSCHASCNEMATVYCHERDSCLVLDCNFTSDGGLQAAAYLAELGIKIPVVYVATAASAANVVAAMKSGAVDFLVKPVRDEVLLRAVQDGIQQDSAARRQFAEQAGISTSESLLTQRERETMALVLDGRSVKQIASEFGIGLQTAAKHRSRLLAKMNVRTDVQLVRLYYSRRMREAL